MSKWSITVLLLVLFITPSRGQTVEEIVSKHIAATGGAEKWKSLESLTIVSNSEDLSFNLYWKKPNRVRIDHTEPECGLIRSFDGTTGWQIMPHESSDPTPMSAGQITALVQQGDWLMELIDYKTKTYRLELLGREAVGVSTAFKLKLTKHAGVMAYIFLDSMSFLEIKRIVPTISPTGQPIDLILDIGDHQRVGGLLLPHRVGSSTRQYEVNSWLHESKFKMPR